MQSGLLSENCRTFEGNNVVWLQETVVVVVC